MILVRFGNPNPGYQSYHIGYVRYILGVDISLFPIHLPGYSGKPRGSARGLSDIPNYIYD
jgi:hypothetical protein